MDQPSVAIVTGASSGLGRSFTLELNRMGTAIVAVARRRDELAETATLVTDAGGRCETMVADVTSPGAAAEAIAVAEDAFGPVDLLVSNAGDVYLAFVERAVPEMWRRALEINLLAPMQWAQAVLPSMRARRRGRIVNISSISAVVPLPSFAAYSASKAGLDQLTACLAAEVVSDGITVLSFAPAAHTDMARRLYEDEAIPAPIRARFDRILHEHGDEMLNYSLDMFRLLVTGGADHLNGQHIGYHASGRTAIDELRPAAK